MSLNDYINYTIEDFILDENFVRWVRNPQDDSAALWHKVLSIYPEKSEQISKARQVILASYNAPESISSAEIRKEVEKFLDQTLYADDEKPAFLNISRYKIRTSRKKIFQRSAVIAAMLLSAFFIHYYFGNQALFPDSISVSIPGKTNNLAETYNNTVSPMQLRLPDGTDVLLSPGSSLKYPSRFEAERRVFLEGEANFSVIHQNTPFLVITGEMVTRVLGTRFTVRAYANEEQNSVKVQSGKVSVYSTARLADSTFQREVKGLILTANQEGLFEKKEYHFSKTLVARPEPVKKIPAYQETEYSEVPLSEILARLEDQFGITIQYNKNSLKPCRITAVFSDETLYEQLDILCKIASVSYQIVDGQIIISGEGCHG